MLFGLNTKLNLVPEQPVAIRSGPVSLFMVVPDQGICIEVPVPTALEAALERQWARLSEPGSRERFIQRLATQIAHVIPEALDWDIKLPTAAQRAYALVLSRKTNTPIPEQAERSRLHMHLFISELAPPATGAKRTSKHTKRLAARASRQ